MKGRLRLIALAVVMLVAIVLWVSRERRPDPPVTTPDTPIIIPRAPVFDRGTVDVASPDGDIERVKVADPEDVVATITVSTSDTSSVSLLVDQQKMVWLPGFRLRREAPRIRLVGDDGRQIVTVVPQRLPIFSTRIRPFAGVSMHKSGYSLHAGALPLRVWFLHLGVRVAYDISGNSESPPVTVAGSAQVEIVRGISVGVDTRGWASISIMMR